MLFFFQQLYWNERQKRQNCEGFYLKKGLHNAFFSFVIFFYHMIKGKCKKVSLKTRPEIWKIEMSICVGKTLLFFFKYFPKKEGSTIGTFLSFFTLSNRGKNWCEMDYKIPMRGAVHKVRHALRGEGVCQKVTLVYKPI